MALLAQNEIDAMVSSARKVSRNPAVPVRQAIRPCDFRTSARLSAAGAQHLTTMHESFARTATGELDLHLGASMQIKLLSLEQFGVRDYIAGSTPSAYLLPCAITPGHGTMIIEFDSDLLFSMLDLMLGGDGGPPGAPRELTDLDEELLKSITRIIIERLEQTWGLDNIKLVPEPPIKPSFAVQFFAPDAKILLLMFEVSVGKFAGSLNLVLPHSFSNFLVRNTQVNAPKRKALDPVAIRHLIEEKVLESSFTVATELIGSTVPVRELIAMVPGTVLQLRVPLTNPVKLMIEGHELFQVTPVRHLNHKAAQLGLALPPPSGEAGFNRQLPKR